MIGFETVLIAAGGLLIMGPRMGAPDRAPRLHAGRRLGILFGVSDVAIKAISGMVAAAGALGLLTPVTLVAWSPRWPRSTPRPRACRTATRSR